jgi:hypothetical protein
MKSPIDNKDLFYTGAAWPEGHATPVRLPYIPPKKHFDFLP